MIYRKVENSFTQPSTKINIQMLEWVLNVISNSCSDLLKLYCDNENFSLVLARHFHRVLTTEITKPLVAAAAQYNMVFNQIYNV